MEHLDVILFFYVHPLEKCKGLLSETQIDQTNVVNQSQNAINFCRGRLPNHCLLWNKIFVLVGGIAAPKVLSLCS
jgi:hypothetical protein